MAVDSATRKTVTVLFCDLVDSTGLGEDLDPEPLRTLLTRWYEAMGAPVERHGGTVEKFIGDAVMAVFGVPVVHEDDALRAVRAALEMQRSLAALNESLRNESRPELHIRIGINSGEVVTGNGRTTLVTGDAVNTAKRLEEAAAAGEILIGEATRRLVENATELEAVRPVAAKGKRAPVESWRVVAAIEGAVPIARRLDAPLVGRADELAFLRGELAAAERDRTCRLATVFGPAGIGKSRIAAELLAAVRGSAGILSARCVPYGDGLTFLPLSDLVRSAGGQDAVVQAVAGEPDGDLIADRICGALGQGDTAQSTDETFWAIRRALETLARRRPIVVCLEDVHWAQPTFLDLLEYLAGWCRDAPILLLCLARPDLLDARPRWGGAPLTLEPLTEPQSRELLRALADEWPLPDEARAGIAAAAEGNPLFLEQMVAMLADTGRTHVPPTIQALLAARLDQLESAERSVLERASVAGREFSRGAVSELSPPEELPLIGSALLSLVRKELVRPAHSSYSGDDGFSFRHALIRDAAYTEIPKESRAGLHERFAGWLAERNGEDELVGYHLEQAYRCRADLGLADEATAERAACALAAAGSRAVAREDMPAGANLIERALALADLGADRPRLLRELGSARWRTGDLAGAAEATGAAVEIAAELGDVRQEWFARLDRAARKQVERHGSDELAAVAAEALRIFGELGDDAGLSRALRRIAIVSLEEWRFDDAAAQAERALGHAKRAGDTSEYAGLADVFCTALLFGTEPAVSAARRCRELLAGFEQMATVRAAVSSTLAVLEAMQESFAEARTLAAAAAAVYDGLGLRLPRVGLAELSASVELLAGDLSAAERELRFAYETIRESGSQHLAGLEAADLASVTARQDHLDEAERWLELARPLIDDTDRSGFVALQLAEARVGAARGRRDEALRHAVAALEVVRESQWLTRLAETLAVRASILGEEPLEALELYELKGNLAAAARLREGLATLRVPR